jgi:hypothetical protein
LPSDAPTPARLVGEFRLAREMPSSRRLEREVGRNVELMSRASPVI